MLTAVAKTTTSSTSSASAKSLGLLGGLRTRSHQFRANILLPSFCAGPRGHRGRRLRPPTMPGCSGDTNWSNSYAKL